MSRRLAGAVIAIVCSGFAGAELRAWRQGPQESGAEALQRGITRLAHKEFEAALNDFEIAAKSMPESSQVIHHRAEAYLGLNRLDAAKASYMHLFVHDRVASHVLMKAMKAWVDARRANPAGVAPATIDAFDAWVRERDTLAMSVGNLGHNSPDWK
jgi:hypothetical protein